MQELSIFVDESGDFGLTDKKHSPYYIITMVFHNQSFDIFKNIERLNESLEYLGHNKKQAIHTEPLIRRETPYKDYSPNERRAVFSKLFFFALNCEISYKTFIYHKKEYENVLKMEMRMVRDISNFIQNHFAFFTDFDKIILYYDNGQHELNRILNSVFAMNLSEYDLRIVSPSEYRLFQVADLICTLELLNEKYKDGKEMTRSEKLIFHTVRDFKKDFYKGISKKQMSL